MTADRERPLAERIEATTSVAELISVVENAGGIKKSDGQPQDLDELRDFFTIRADEILATIDRLYRIAPSLFAGVTGTDGLRNKLISLYLKELAAKKAELGG